MLDDIIRFLTETIGNSQMAHRIAHMGHHAFGHWLQQNSQALWEAAKDAIEQVYDFICEWITG